MVRLVLTVVTIPLAALASPAAEPADWSSYNGTVSGWRCNTAEKHLSAANVAQLEEKWRFPARDTSRTIGVVHGTPVVVAGCVYFATATEPTVYKLTPDGQLEWSYRLTPRPANKKLDVPAEEQSPGVYGSVLVTDDGVYCADLAGYLYGLDRQTGREKWKVDTRAPPFPNPHPLNGSFASPILADGKIIFAGGAFEQWYAHKKGYKGCTGRGFVVAVDPRSGQVMWKYDVGPKPEPLDPPLTIRDAWGEHVFHFGPSTSTVWSTPSYDAESNTLFFGTDTHNSPRRPTPDNPRLDTDYGCAIIAIDAASGQEKWVTPINRGDIWHRGMRGYDPQTGRYLDQSIGDTPKVYTITRDGQAVRVVGAGCKNGGFYVLHAKTGAILAHTPIYRGPPKLPLDPPPDRRTLALPGPLGGLQTGCATDGRCVFTNGLDAILLGTQESEAASLAPPTAGRVVCLSGDTRCEHWRHERPKTVPAGRGLRLLVKECGDPVASGVAVANGVVYFTTTISQKLVVLDASRGQLLKEIAIGPVWSGPAVSRGRVYVGTGNVLFSSAGDFTLFPHQPHGVIISFGLPGDDEISRLGRRPK
ncbi:MAG: PQQ-binding-like beta-propeller repeat protein [Gemmataceae bacterium]|nr:PQQ-binding-like beta-propeller repeat protein [Gemmata sp.]MDW8196853.1 PQQ-binding-like beta-propeller repeat protein [Gemmataceae bacterium]